MAASTDLAMKLRGSADPVPPLLCPPIFHVSARMASPQIQERLVLKKFGFFLRLRVSWIIV